MHKVLVFSQFLRHFTTRQGPHHHHLSGAATASIIAFLLFPAAGYHAFLVSHLVIAGGRGWLSDPVFARIEELEVQDRVHVVGYVPEEEKRLWYGASTCFCYPSLYEGFGLPPLEAMACGVPVITSNVSSLPEVVGEAGLTVPPEETRALSEALSRVLDDVGLRAELSLKGLARAKQFSWAESARQTAAVYRAAMAHHPNTNRK